MSPFLFDADLGATEIGRKARQVKVADVIVDLFGDEFTRALYRETSYNVPDDQRETCPVHQDWRRNCVGLHLRAAA